MPSPTQTTKLALCTIITLKRAHARQHLQRANVFRVSFFNGMFIVSFRKKRVVSERYLQKNSVNFRATHRIISIALLDALIWLPVTCQKTVRFSYELKRYLLLNCMYRPSHRQSPSRKEPVLRQNEELIYPLDQANI